MILHFGAKVRATHTHDNEIIIIVVITKTTTIIITGGAVCGDGAEPRTKANRAEHATQWWGKKAHGNTSGIQDVSEQAPHPHPALNVDFHRSR